MSADLFNAFFELFGGAFVMLNVIDIWKKRIVAGQTLTAMGFFTSWGIWNMFYYPLLGQWWSAAGALGVCAVNALMIYSILKFRAV